VIEASLVILESKEPEVPLDLEDFQGHVFQDLKE